MSKRSKIDLMNYFGTDKLPPKQLQLRSLGVCPSVERTAYPLLEVKSDGSVYYDGVSGEIKTKTTLSVRKVDRMVNRLVELTDKIQQLIENNDVHIVVISTSRHSQTSIGAVDMAVDRCGVRSEIMTPQAVKSALRLPDSAGADYLIQLASRIVRADVHTTQSADAILCACAGVLEISR